MIPPYYTVHNRCNQTIKLGSSVNKKKEIEMITHDCFIGRMEMASNIEHNQHENMCKNISNSKNQSTQLSMIAIFSLSLSLHFVHVFFLALLMICWAKTKIDARTDFFLLWPPLLDAFYSAEILFIPQKFEYFFNLPGISFQLVWSNPLPSVFLLTHSNALPTFTLMFTLFLAHSLNWNINWVVIHFRAHKKCSKNVT